MTFEGRIRKSDKSRFWLIEIPALDLMTQGASKLEAFDMLKDALSGLVNQSGFRPRFETQRGESFTLETNEDQAVFALLLRRQRAKSGLTIREVAKLLGTRSLNSYAAYEAGRREPSLTKMEELLTAVSPQSKLRLRVG